MKPARKKNSSAVQIKSVIRDLYLHELEVQYSQILISLWAPLISDQKGKGLQSLDVVVELSSNHTPSRRNILELLQVLIVSVIYVQLLV